MDRLIAGADLPNFHHRFKRAAEQRGLTHKEVVRRMLDIAKKRGPIPAAVEAKLVPNQRGWLDQALGYEKQCSGNAAPYPRSIQATPHLELLAAVFGLHARSFLQEGPRLDKPGAWREEPPDDPVFERHLQLAARGIDLSLPADEFLASTIFADPAYRLATAVPGLLRVREELRGSKDCLMRAEPDSDDGSVRIRCEQKIWFEVTLPSGFEGGLVLVLDRYPPPPGQAASEPPSVVDLFGPFRPDAARVPNAAGAAIPLHEPITLDGSLGRGSYALILMTMNLDLPILLPRQKVGDEAYEKNMRARLEKLKWALCQAAQGDWIFSITDYVIVQHDHVTTSADARKLK